jgi:predicted DNA-binding ribbon-helix-helix protein
MKTTSIRIDEEQWKTARERAKTLKLSVGAYIAQLVQKDLGSEKHEDV